MTASKASSVRNMIDKNAFSSPKKIIVSRSGILGDTLVALPSLWVLRDAFPLASIVYLYERLLLQDFVSPPQILDGSGLVNQFYAYLSFKNPLLKFCSSIPLYFHLHRHAFDLGIVLEEPHWSSRRKKFLKACGVEIVIGPDGSEPQIQRDDAGRLKLLPHIADTLMDILRPLGVSIPPPGKGSMVLPRTQSDRIKIDLWVKKQRCFENDRPKIALAPWSNMPLKRWPLGRYKEVVRRLIVEYEVIPIVFGSTRESDIGEELVRSWKQGLVVTGELSIREGVELLSRCDLFLGNDTGTMHMAVCAGIPCVAIFSARDNPGRWEPYGSIHFVFRRSVPCEGCMLRVCSENKMRCILSIGIDEVSEACHQILREKLGGKKPYHV